MILRVYSELLEYVNFPESSSNTPVNIKEDESKFILITLDIFRAFHRWIPHSVLDKTSVLGWKLIDITALYLLHDDFCLLCIRSFSTS